MAKSLGFQPSVIYADPKAAMRWLEAAFGFELALYLEGEDGAFIHCQMRYGDALISVGQEWSEAFKSPLRLDGKNTQLTSLQIDSDVDAHCERARRAGAVIVAEPETQFYGDRSYRCLDPEGHHWSVSQTVEAVTADEALQRVGGGMKITGWV
ncbi:VOC family protein [Caulobacter sp. KR2-114]|uniref:VOC family protein n=1 Tax=Caulobacter sp. KR2-114 TaxID=3400912 RepID=UPI003C009412